MHAHGPGSGHGAGSLDLRSQSRGGVPPGGRAKKTWSGRSADERRSIIRQVASIRPSEARQIVSTDARGTIRRPGYRIDQLVLTPDDGLPLPALRFIPEKTNGRTWLYLHGKGKHVDASPGGAIEQLVREGAEVLAVDLSGCGKTAMFPWRYGPPGVTGNNGAETTVAYMLGRSLLGRRAGDVLLAANSPEYCFPEATYGLERSPGLAVSMQKAVPTEYTEHTEKSG